MKEIKLSQGETLGNGKVERWLIKKQTIKKEEQNQTKRLRSQKEKRSQKTEEKHRRNRQITKDEKAGEMEIRTSFVAYGDY